MNLLMFEDACEHMARIARILKFPQGHAFLLGIEGTGKQSAAKIACFLMQIKIFQIDLIKNYTFRNWRDDLKNVLTFTGIENKSIGFILRDTQIYQYSFIMEDINIVLKNAGEIPGLYTQKDLEEIMQSCKYDQWPQEALIGVGKLQLQNFHINEENNEENIKNQKNMEDQEINQITLVLTKIHQSVQKASIKFKKELNRTNYVTPASFLEYISTFKNLNISKKEEIANSISRLKSGLDILEEANKQIKEMEAALKEMQPQLLAAQIETEKMMDSLIEEKNKADAKQKIVAEEELIASLQQQEATKLALEAESSVAEANIILSLTLAEVQKLKKEHLVEIKALGSPPQAVKITLAGVVILNTEKIKQNGGEIIMQVKEGQQLTMKKEENYFETAKRYLLNDTRELLEMLMNFDKDSIQQSTIIKLEQKVLSMPEFNIQSAERCSYATKFLFMWVKAMADYYKVYSDSKPLREKLIQMKKNVEEKTQELLIKKDALQKINEQIQLLQFDFDQKMIQKNNFTQQIILCQQKLQRAQKLIECLHEEKLRWASDISKLQKKIKQTIPLSLFSSAKITYNGPFTQKYRQRLSEKIQKIILKQPAFHNVQKDQFDIQIFLSSSLKIQQMHMQELPKDETSIENGIIMDKTPRWPLIIDPQNQANKYIRNLSRENPEGFEVAKVNQKTLLKVFETAIQSGKYLLYENIGLDDLETALESVFVKNISEFGNKMIINIGNKTLEYMDSFRLFITSCLPNPNFPPEYYVKFTVINFAVTPYGLEEQLLAQIVSLENPDLEEMKIVIVKKNAKEENDLLKIEDQILKCLSDIKDINEILKDENLIIQLQSSKMFAQEINERVTQSSEYIKSPPLDLQKICRDSTNITPLIFVLSPGSDPLIHFKKLSENEKMLKKTAYISLGQGQGPKAEKLIKEYVQKGGWIMLQNCHLCQSWMHNLSLICQELNENTNKDFRLWLTSMPSADFPIQILQNSIKITMEPPQTVRENLVNTFFQIKDLQTYDSLSKYQQKLIFSFSLFHSVIQERKRFGSIGWNLQYEFTNEDLSVCLKQLNFIFQQKYDIIPLKVLIFLGAEINYGGRVTDNNDLKLINQILTDYIENEEEFSLNSKQEVLDFIQQMPINTTPEFFGLHSNAEINNSLENLRFLLENALLLQPSYQYQEENSSNYFFLKWIELQKAPSPIWISSFFFPQGFLTAT
ncbi:hypothetical protein IMG5_184920, partial [Ichthyophthirius multifiliis]